MCQRFEVADMDYSGTGLGPGKTTLLDAKDLTQMALDGAHRRAR